MQQPPPVKGQPPAPSPFATLQEAARARNEFFKQEGVAAVLRDSNKPHGLFNMTGIGGAEGDNRGIPPAVGARDRERLLFRPLKEGEGGGGKRSGDQAGREPQD